MRPEVGVRNFVSRLKQVVLPAPFGPISAWIVPRRTFRSTLSTATKPLNSFVSACVCRMYCALTGAPSACGRSRRAERNAPFGAAVRARSCRDPDTARARHRCRRRAAAEAPGQRTGHIERELAVALVAGRAEQRYRKLALDVARAL